MPHPLRFLACGKENGDRLRDIEASSGTSFVDYKRPILHTYFDDMVAAKAVYC